MMVKLKHRNFFPMVLVFDFLHEILCDMSDAVNMTKRRIMPPVLRIIELEDSDMLAKSRLTRFILALQKRWPLETHFLFFNR